MVVDNKTLTFHINNFAYTIDIGPDLNGEVQEEITKFLDLDKEITTKELLLAYLRRTYEFIAFKKDVQTQIQRVDEFNQTKT